MGSDLQFIVEARISGKWEYINYSGFIEEHCSRNYELMHLLCGMFNSETEDGHFSRPDYRLDNSGKMVKYEQYSVEDLYQLDSREPFTPLDISEKTKEMMKIYCEESVTCYLASEILANANNIIYKKFGGKKLKEVFQQFFTIVEKFSSIYGADKTRFLCWVD